MSIELGLTTKIVVKEHVGVGSRQTFEELDCLPEEALVDALAALRRAGVHAFITYGTLLGWVRQNGFLDGDMDIDFAIESWSDQDAIIREMQSAGFDYVEECRTARGIVNQKFMSRAGVMIDLYFLFRLGDVLVIEYPVARHSMARCDQPIRDIEEVRFEGLPVPVPIPHDPESYLTHLYGESWREPVKHWDWVYSPPNAHITAALPDWPWLAVRWLLTRSPGLASALKTFKHRWQAFREPD